MLLTVSLLAALVASDSTPRAPAPLATERGGQAAAAIVVHRQPAIPLVALRMALLADDPPGYAGAGHLFQHLAHPLLREGVARVGGRVQIERTSDAVVYTVVGPKEELAHLAAVLRSALRPPQPTEAALLRASRELAEERLAEWETARRHVRAALRARLFPGDLPAAGTEASALRLSELEGMRTAWAHLYRPERVSIVAVGDVRTEDIRLAFGDLPPATAPPPAAELRDTISLEPLAPAEATRGWLGTGYLATDLDPAALSVAARLVRDRLQERLPTAAVEAEHWWTHQGQALAVTVSSPEADLADARRAIGAAVASALEGLPAAEVRSAAKAIRREILFYARTPDRMADVLGQFTDRGGHPDAAQRFYAELERVGVDDVRYALTALLTQTPARVEVPPQKLKPR